MTRIVRDCQGDDVTSAPRGGDDRELLDDPASAGT
jgi:hypothetical protein